MGRRSEDYRDTAAPILQGELHPVRGRYDFAGKIFVLQDSSITFTGGDEIDPILDISAERAASDLTAIIHVTGTAKKPKVALESMSYLCQVGRGLKNVVASNVTTPV